MYKIKCVLMSYTYSYRPSGATQGFHWCAFQRKYAEVSAINAHKRYVKYEQIQCIHKCYVNKATGAGCNHPAERRAPSD